jgi:hypothetical protein
MTYAVPMLHGSVGWLDELLACGILLAVGLVIFFLTALFGKRSKN